MVVVVLGHRLRSPVPHRQLRGRVDCGLDLLRSTGDRHLLLSGGRANPAVDVTESEAMRRYAVERGVSADRILTDGWALDTIGNGVASRLIVEQTDAAEPVRVVTSCFHRDRATYVFERCFGPGYRVTAPECYDASGEVAPETVRAEADKLESAREFFAPIDDGDVESIVDRLETAHRCYEDVERSLARELPP